MGNDSDVRVALRCVQSTKKPVNGTGIESDYFLVGSVRCWDRKQLLKNSKINK